MKKIISMVLVMAMLLTMVSTVSFASAEEIEMELYAEDYGPAEIILSDDFSDFGTDEALDVDHSGWELKGERDTQFDVLPHVLESTSSTPYISYASEELGGNTAGVLVLFDDWWMTGTLNPKYQIPDLWGAWDFACVEAGVEFYAGTSEDDLEKIDIERAGFIRPGQGQQIMVELLAQLPADATYFKFMINNSNWTHKLCWVNLYAGTPADVEAAYPDATYNDYNEDMVMPTVTPTPTPKPLATVDPGSIDPDTGLGTIIWDQMYDLSQAYSVDNYEIKNGDVTVNGVQYSSYLESSGAGNYTEPASITYRGKFGGATVSFLTSFHDDLLTQTIASLHPEIEDIWGAYEEAMDYVDYRVYAGYTLGSMVEVSADPANVSYDFEKPTEGESMGVWMNVANLPANAQYVTIEINMPSGNWMAKINEVYIEGTGELVESPIVGTLRTFQDNFSTITTVEEGANVMSTVDNLNGELFSTISSSLCFWSTKTSVGTSFSAANPTGAMEGYWDGSGTTSYIGYEGDFGGNAVQVVLTAGDDQYKKAYAAEYGESAALQWGQYPVLWNQIFKYKFHVYAGTSEDDLQEVTINSIAGEGMSGATVLAINSNILPEGTTYFKVQIDDIFYWPYKLLEIECNNPYALKADFDPEDNISPEGPEPTPTPEPTPVPDETAIFDNFNSLTDEAIENGTYLDNETEGALFVDAANLRYRTWTENHLPAIDKVLGEDQSQYLEGSDGAVDSYLVYTGEIEGKTLEFETVMNDTQNMDARSYVNAYAPIIQVSDNGDSWTDVEATHYLYNDTVQYIGWDGYFGKICTFIVDELPAGSYIKVGFNGNYAKKILSVSLDANSTVLNSSSVMTKKEVFAGPLTTFADNFGSLKLLDKTVAEGANEVYMNSAADVAKPMFSTVSNLCYYAGKSPSAATSFNAAGGHVEGSWGSPAMATIGYTGEFGEGYGTQIVLGVGDDQYKTAFYAIKGEDAALQWGQYEVIWEYYFKDKVRLYAGTSEEDLEQITFNAIDGQGLQGMCVVAINSNVLPEGTTYFKFEIDDFHWMYKLLEVECNDPYAINPDYNPDDVIGGGSDVSDVVYGDTNGDGSIDVSDVVLLVEYIGKLSIGEELDPDMFPNGAFPGGEASAKLTADDIIDVSDAVLLVEYIGKLSIGEPLDPDMFPNGTFPGAAN